MAKRKRLTPAQPGAFGLQADPPGLRPGAAADGPDETPPEVKARPPIAQVAGNSATSAALGELAEMVDQARAEGRLIQRLPLDEVAPSHLVRDRIAMDDEELQALVQSLRARGQQTPIEVVDRGAGQVPRYGLISGYRRIAALRRLAGDDPAFAQVLAVVRQPASASDAYVAMVEENEIRVGLSYYERARIVVKALEQGVYDSDKQALQSLFANVSRSKRSKIKSFMAVVEALDGALRFPTAIGERLGLDLSRVLGDPAQAAALRSMLEAEPADSAEAELARLSAAVTAERPQPVTPPSPAPTRNRGATPAPARKPVQVQTVRGKLVLTGPGVDDELLAELSHWLRRRGHPEQ